MTPTEIISAARDPAAARAALFDAFEREVTLGVIELVTALIGHELVALPRAARAQLPADSIARMTMQVMFETVGVSVDRARVYQQQFLALERRSAPAESVTFKEV